MTNTQHEQRLSDAIELLTYKILPRGQHQILKVALEHGRPISRTTLLTRIGEQREACGKPASGAATVLNALRRRVASSLPHRDPPLSAVFQTGSGIEPFDKDNPTVTASLWPEVILATSLVADTDGRTLADVLAGPWQRINDLGPDEARHPHYKR